MRHTWERTASDLKGAGLFMPQSLARPQEQMGSGCALESLAIMLTSLITWPSKQVGFKIPEWEGVWTRKGF